MTFIAHCGIVPAPASASMYPSGLFGSIDCA